MIAHLICKAFECALELLSFIAKKPFRRNVRQESTQIQMIQKNLKRYRQTRSTKKLFITSSHFKEKNSRSFSVKIFRRTLFFVFLHKRYILLNLAKESQIIKKIYDGTEKS